MKYGFMVVCYTTFLASYMALQHISFTVANVAMTAFVAVVVIGVNVLHDMRVHSRRDH